MRSSVRHAFASLIGLLIVPSLPLKDHNHHLGPSASRPAEARTSPIEADGTVNVPAFRLPPSVYLSDATKTALPRKPKVYEDIFSQVDHAAAENLRKMVGASVATNIQRAKQLFPVQTKETTVAGIRAISVTPANGAKILIKLTGGGFMVGELRGPGIIGVDTRFRTHRI